MTPSRARPGIVAEPAEADVVKLIFQLYEQSSGLEAVAKEIRARGIPAPKGGPYWRANTVSKVLTNPLHAGLIAHEGKYIQGAHWDERLVDPNTFFRIQELLRSRRRFSGRTHGCPEALLGRLTWCAECKSRLVLVHRLGKNYGYRCRGPKLDIDCETRPYVRGEFLEQRVRDLLLEYASKPEVLEEARRVALGLFKKEYANGNEETRVRDELAKLQKHRDAAAAQYTDGALSEQLLQSIDRQVNEQAFKLERRLSELMAVGDSRRTLEEDFAKVEGLLADLPRLWEEASPERRRALCEALIERVEVGLAQGAVSIRVLFKYLPEQRFMLPIGFQWRRIRKGKFCARITRRQLAYLALVADGLNDKAIRKRFQVSSSTVNTLRNRAIDAMGAENEREAAVLAASLIAQWRDLLPLEGRVQQAKAAADSTYPKRTDFPSRPGRRAHCQPGGPGQRLSRGYCGWQKTKGQHQAQSPSGGSSSCKGSRPWLAKSRGTLNRTASARLSSACRGRPGRTTWSRQADQIAASVSGTAATGAEPARDSQTQEG